ncbi:MAG: aldo/keto reductase [Planctomycetes bacterium]|nr:aldo/keto reductase [Planctomycetota bacterium]
MSNNTDNEVPILDGPDGSMPGLGLGTWKLKGDQCVQAVRAALGMGYNHVDTAQIYGNEAEVGEGIASSKVERSDIFLTTKIWHEWLDEDGVQNSLDESLEKLQTDYVDLLLIHWPNRDVPVGETLGAMAEASEQGKVRHIGVSNFTVSLLEEATEASDMPIFCNQVEYHPFLSQDPVLGWCRTHNALLVAYSPLARGGILEEPRLEEIGKKYDKTAAQVVLRWFMQQPSVVAIPKASSVDHLEENFDIFDFELGEDEMDAIFGLAKDGRLINPGWAPDWD